MKKLILPVLMIALAVTSAFTTDFASEKDLDSTIINGHKRLSANLKDCQVSDECQIEFNNTVCRVGQVSTGAQLWDLNGALECVVPLYKPMPQ